MAIYQVHLHQMVRYVVEVQAESAMRAYHAAKAGVPWKVTLDPDVPSPPVATLTLSGWTVDMVHEVDEKAAEQLRLEDERKARQVLKRKRAKMDKSEE